MDASTEHEASWLFDSSLSERYAKRTRVSVACSRCKSRKSKCDGAHPHCSACLTANVECQYPHSSRPPSKTQYIRALEDRVVELEKKLARLTKNEGDVPPRESDSTGDDGSPSQSQVNVPGNAEGGVSSLVSLIRDLSCESGGVYVGASSNISMGRMMASVVRNGGKPETIREVECGEDLSPRSVFCVNLPDAAAIDLEDVPSEVATRLYHGYLQHISTRWPILHTPFIADIHQHRDCLDRLEDKILLHLVYANGGRYLETTGEVGNFFPERHYNAAIEHLEAIVGWRNLRTVQILLLLGIYSLRAPKVPGAWNYVGLAMRTCVELGMHRRKSFSYPTLEDELSNRVFWSGYMLDRQISLALGRPFALPDHDIDAMMPMNVDEEATSLDVNNNTLPKSSSLACFRQTIKIRQIESRIKDTIYRLDRSTDDISDATISRFQMDLENWKDEIPPPNHVPADLGPRPYDGYDYYMHFYYNCLRQLYFPIVLSQRSRYVKECAKACIGVCETFKKLHRNSVVGYSLWALQTVFLAGLTLIYTIWINPGELYSQRAIGALNDCNVILYIIVERWPMAKKYRDAFEEIKDSVAVLVADGKQEQRPILPRNSNAIAREVLAEESGFHDYGQMILDMTQQTPPESQGTTVENGGIPVHSSFTPDIGQMPSNHAVFHFDDEILFDIPTGMDDFGNSMYMPQNT
ncbi:hypothetical protein JX265_002177 [Neoarthrinium moseri]|uniref:Zn(2)-C6 fungal-type domain-containing protein n=1 Tax=Neoarthrinium moseri TaxID=1658444 RepID=A0A9Q0AU18_9PEZI|nr:uncharacterized protein JN550_007486 [Neoarthrinium moseri]KAI1866633.1 hypothetical protein JN550_007486 [Neoarthrinium moseri]KAI1879223.1 hypothetical protein JX265_002177 [Neoarthrinium moseri]